MKKTVSDFFEMKRKSEKISMISLYDYPMARLAEKVGFDIILIGDSGAQAVYGHPSTVPATMEQMIAHCQAVRRGAPNSFIQGDMPFLSYQLSVKDAIYNAGRFYKEADVDSIKLEGGRGITEQVKGIVDAGMSVVAHMGFTPQSAAQSQFGALEPTAENAMELIKDALALEKAGAFAILMDTPPPAAGSEAGSVVTAEVMKIITEKCRVPTIGFGAGPHCDGQVMAACDILGFFEVGDPKFVKKYANLSETIEKVFGDFVGEVRTGKFPEEKHHFRMPEGELEKLKALLEKSHI